MTHWLPFSAAAAGAVAGATVISVTVGARRWNRETTRAVERLSTRSSRPDAETMPRFSHDQLEGLPDNVARYLAFALSPGQRMVRQARLRQAGEFAMRPGSWSPFTAVEIFSVQPLGFVWDATIRVTRVIPVRVRDSYIAGEGAMRGTIAGLVSVVDQRGTPEMAVASLMRCLAEAPWLPTALLPAEGVSWTAIDAGAARATVTAGVTAASVDFHFGTHGEIVRAMAIRYRDVDGRAVPTPWVGRFSQYTRVEGMMIPMAAEVEWVLPDRAFPYWRGRMLSVEYDFAR